MARPVVAPMPGLRRWRALVHPAQVLASAAFAPWPGGVVLAAHHPWPAAYAPAPDVTGWPEQSRESAWTPAAMAGHSRSGAWPSRRWGKHAEPPLSQVSFGCLRCSWKGLQAASWTRYLKRCPRRITALLPGLLPNGLQVTADRSVSARLLVGRSDVPDQVSLYLVARGALPGRVLRLAAEADCIFAIDTGTHAPGQLGWLATAARGPIGSVCHPTG
jgi:hypothetical protein